jgi:hypothetical protein
MATPGRARPGPGADVGGVSPVPAQMWQCARCNMYRFATSCTVLQHPVLSCNFLYCLATCAALRAYDKYGEFALFLVRKGQVVRHLLHAACCMLHVARCTLSVVCCLLRVAAASSFSVAIRNGTAVRQCERALLAVVQTFCRAATGTATKQWHGRAFCTEQVTSPVPLSIAKGEDAPSVLERALGPSWATLARPGHRHAPCCGARHRCVVESAASLRRRMCVRPGLV